MPLLCLISYLVFDLESKSYIETLFGHQDAVQAIDANLKERCITAGGRDNTIRVFKIPEETQLLYRWDFYSKLHFSWFNLGPENVFVFMALIVCLHDFCGDCSRVTFIFKIEFSWSNNGWFKCTKTYEHRLNLECKIRIYTVNPFQFWVFLIISVVWAADSIISYSVQSF